MFKSTIRIFSFLFIAIACLHGPRLLAANVAVGPADCKPNLKHYSTIQAAVSAAVSGSTVMVCAGTYPEQVIINHPLTLQGISFGTAGAAVITVPLGGLVQNTTGSVGPVSAQLAVENTDLVTIENMVIDGAGSGCPAGANRIYGILFSFVGVPSDGDSGGKIKNNVVRNVPNTCVHGDGMIIENSYVTISGNEIHDIGITPVYVLSGQATVTNNDIQNSLNGIVLETTSAATVVTGNTVSNLVPNLGFSEVGYWVESGAGKLSNNTLANAPSGYGIYLDFDLAGTIVTGNQVNAAYYGAYLYNDTGVICQSNGISYALGYGIVDDTSLGGNTITKNTVNESPYGIFQVGTSSDVLDPNTLNNVVVTVDPSTSLSLGATTPN